MKKFFKEFRAFIAKGNALDLAVGIVIGTAFNKIISSLVKDIIMPLISLIGSKDVTEWVWVMRGTRTWDAVNGIYVLSEDAVLLTYGNFIQSIIDFLIIALAIFLALKVINGLKGKLDDAKKVIAAKVEKE
ncbi:MAG: large conductance mechanosensitive channel protein MscL [Candidatus Izemoplasmatales bacterium]